MKKKLYQNKQSRMRGRNVMPLTLVCATCLLMLTGCASRQMQSSVSCPEPVTLPASVSDSKLPDAQSYSQEVADYLSEVSSYLKALQ